METIKAKIKLMDSFNITGLGVVLAGEFLEGVFNIGDKIQFVWHNKSYQLKIKSFNNIRHKTILNCIGILVETKETEFQELYHNPLLKDIIAEII